MNFETTNFKIYNCEMEETTPNFIQHPILFIKKVLAIGKGTLLKLYNFGLVLFYFVSDSVGYFPTLASGVATI